MSSGAGRRPEPWPKIDRYLEAVLKSRASDLHFLSGDPAAGAGHGDLQILMQDAGSASST